MHPLLDKLGLIRYTKLLKNELEGKLNRDEFSTTGDITEGSKSLITSGAVYDALQKKADVDIEPMPVGPLIVNRVDAAVKALNDYKLSITDIDENLSSTSKNPVQNKAVKAAIDAIVVGTDSITYVESISDIETIMDRIYGVGTTTITFYFGNSTAGTLSPLNVSVDMTLDPDSNNPVANSVICAMLQKQILTAPVIVDGVECTTVEEAIAAFANRVSITVEEVDDLFNT